MDEAGNAKETIGFYIHVGTRRAMDATNRLSSIDAEALPLRVFALDDTYGFL
jgi:hypothetical protein